MVKINKSIRHCYIEATKKVHFHIFFTIVIFKLYLIVCLCLCVYIHINQAFKCEVGILGRGEICQCRWPLLPSLSENLVYIYTSLLCMHQQKENVVCFKCVMMLNSGFTYEMIGFVGILV